MKTASKDSSAILDDAAHALGASYYSEIIDLVNLKGLSIHSIIDTPSGDLAGKFYLQYSNKKTATDTQWVTDTTSETAIINTDVAKMWGVDKINFRYTRVKWLRTAGTGNVTHIYNVKSNH